jgi:hypothetical protein
MFKIYVQNDNIPVHIKKKFKKINTRTLVKENINTLK